MEHVSVDALLDQGIAAQNDGNLALADQLYAAALTQDPDNAEALNLHGVLRFLAGDTYAALALLKRAVTLDPDAPEFHFNLAEAIFKTGDRAAAANEFAQAFTLDPTLIPNAPDKLEQLVESFTEQKQYQALIPTYQKLIGLRPSASASLGLALAQCETGDFAAGYTTAAETLQHYPQAIQAHYILGFSADRQRFFDKAVIHFSDLLRIQPGHVSSLINLGAAQKKNGDTKEALITLNRVLELAPDSFEAFYNIALIHHDAGRAPEALDYCEHALAVRPDDSGATILRAGVLQRLRRSNEALDLMLRYTERNPGDHAAFNTLGVIYLDRGAIRDALAAFRASSPHTSINPPVNSNLLLTATYDDLLSALELFQLHTGWGNSLPRVARPPLKLRRNERIKIGYVSSDFRNHSVAFFLCPVLAFHDKSKVEVYCYASVKSADHVTDLFRAYVDHWRDITNASDEAVAAGIRDDGIDILIDLNGHTDGTRLGVFALRPAPIQTSFIGYPGTTGLPAMDYQISDSILHPPGQNEPYASEQIVRLPDIFACYRAPGNTPPVGPLPVLRNGFITFGYFNNLAKLRDSVLAAWALIAEKVPTAKFVIQTFAIDDPAIRDLVLKRCVAAGIPAQQIDLRGTSSLTQFHDDLQSIDIVLDPFPFNGHTTSCQILHTGVPIVTLAGRTRSGRMGASLLINLGLRDLVALSIEEYVDIAIRLAGDINFLNKLRIGLRDQMENSVIMDAPKYTRNLESAFETMIEQTLMLGAAAQPIIAPARTGVLDPTRKLATAFTHNALWPATSDRPSAQPVALRSIEVRKTKYAQIGETLLFSVVVCSRTPRRIAWAEQHYKQVLSTSGFEFIHVVNPPSLAAGYNRAILEAEGTHVLFAHDDIEFLDADAASRIAQQLESCDVLGVAGTNKLIDATWIAAGHPHIFGQIIQKDSIGKGFYRIAYGAVPPEMPKMQAIDGLLIAVRRTVLTRVTFDADNFDGFHLYDVDFSYAAHRAGFRVGVFRDLNIIHDSGGNFDSVWEFYRDRFRHKYDVPGVSPSDKTPSFTQLYVPSRAALIKQLEAPDEAINLSI